MDDKKTEYRINPEGMVVEEIESAARIAAEALPIAPPPQITRLLEPPVVQPLYRHPFLRRAHFSSI
ncbi:MAG: hypothetical protein JW821_18240 [Deltaproteobacteria bacterium]|nr:hypothetical protein [Deltaproteobacteria bacterium]